MRQWLQRGSGVRCSPVGSSVPRCQPWGANVSVVSNQAAHVSSCYASYRSIFNYEMLIIVSSRVVDANVYDVSKSEGWEDNDLNTDTGHQCELHMVKKMQPFY